MLHVLQATEQRAGIHGHQQVAEQDANAYRAIGPPLGRQRDQAADAHGAQEACPGQIPHAEAKAVADGHERIHKEVQGAECPRLVQPQGDNQNVVDRAQYPPWSRDARLPQDVRQ
jgi:hypothetical protein